ncbi:7174_t:CDS:2 [Ambispora leptoticha]|uniref:7174_t:CDS:1 n=1 Tax=Ambispora leptoticha TaxID=144679 RepID=A0A9N9CKH8_9GLOM|nr:7174_t:CDS:2 [Ambispora leptoticha]
MLINTETSTAIAFSIPILVNAKDVKEIHINATYKTAKGYFELFAIVGQFNSSGFALGYLMLDIHQDEDLTKITILTEFFTHFQNLRLWICSYSSFLQNRFLICKHLVKAVGGTANHLIYEEFKRNYEYSFLILKSLENVESQMLSVSDNEQSSAIIQAADRSLQRNNLELEKSVPISNEKFEKEISELKEYLTHMCSEFNIRNLRHVKVLMDASKKSHNMIVDIKKRENKCI